MSAFFFEIQASAIYSVTAPTLEILVDGIVVSSALMSGSSATYAFTLDYSGTYPTSLSLRFNDGSSEPGRSITFSAFAINGWNVSTSYLGALTVLNGQSSAVSIANTDHLYGRETPTAPDIGTPTQTGTTGDDRISVPATPPAPSQPDIINAGDGNDRVIGSNNVSGNAIFGGLGDDTLFGGTGNDIIVGGAGNDTIIGNAGADILHGGDDNDTIQGNAGNDTINGGAGADSLQGGDGNDIIFGEAGNDLISGAAGNDLLFGDAGDDNMTGGIGNDIMYGGLDNDRMQGDGGDDTLYGEAGNDLLFGGAGNDILNGNNGDDELSGGVGNDILNGDAGNDFIDGDAGDDTINGGADTDTLSYRNAASGITLSLALATAQITGGAGTDTVSNIENLTGSAFDDVLEGTSGNNTLTGGLGSDTVSYANASAGVTVNLATLIAQNTVGAGTDTLSGFENLRGSAFNDTLTGDGSDNIIEGGVGNDAINGAGGTDTVTYANATSGVTVSLFLAGAQVTGGAGTDTLTSIENLTGSAFNDVLEGSTANNILIGGLGTDRLTYANAVAAVTVNLATLTAQNTVGAGTDTLSGFENLTGSAFNDTLTGDNNDNVIEGLAGNDTLAGGGGTDTVTYTNSVSAVTVNLATLTAQNTVGAGTDTLSGFENLTGSAFNDYLTGDASANALDGGAGNDIIEGGAGNDTLTGGSGTDTVTYKNASAAVTVNLATLTGQNTVGAGTDTLSGFENLTGSAYDDTLTGDAAANIISGGSGSDTISGGDGNDTLYAVSRAITLFSTNFNATTESFTYADNVFGGAGGAYVNGTRNTTDGVGGNGSLEVLFDGTNTTSSGTMSGGWTYSFTAADITDNTVLSFDYKVVREGTYETNEDSYVYVMLNGSYYGVNTNDYITKFESDGNDPQYDTGWIHLSVNFGTLAAGTHSLVIGGLVEGKDAANEDTTIRFDNIIVASDVGNDDTKSNILDGGNNDDILYGSAGTDTLNGGAGNDTITSGSIAGITSADVLAAYSGVVYNATTNSFYQYVNSSVTWQVAQTAATSSLIFGTAGHLVHSNSAVENTYIDSISGTNSIHMGGSDGLVNGEWRWVGGEADAVQFWQGLAGGNAVGGAYTNWAAGEPNDYNNYESRLMMYNGGSWNDQLEGTGAQYVIEWEADQILVTGNTTTINGGAGNDTVNGGAGNDVVDGGDGNDILYGGGGTDVLYGGNNNDEIHSGSVSVVTLVTILSANFDSGNNGFSYSDGGFGGTDPANADVAGTRNTSDGDTANGALQVYIDGQNNTASTNISGAWSQTFNLAGAVAGTELSLSYRHWHDTSNDAGEDSRVYVEIDGVRYGVGGNDYISQALGSGGTTDTGWVQIVLDTGALTAGNHTITMGIFQTAENGNSEDSYVRFDDLTLSYSDPVGAITTLSGQDGLDLLYGSGGRDHFIFEAASAFNNIDQIYNYDGTDLDVLDIGNLLSGYVAGVSDNDLFARFTVSGADLLLQVDANGATGGSSYSTIANLVGQSASGLVIDDMVASGLLLMT